MHAAIVQILNKLADDEILALTTTVTQGLLKNKIRNRRQATEVILKYSSDEVSLLRRKCITREILFEYAHENNIQINLPTTKSELIEKICSYWNISTKPEEKFRLDSVPQEKRFVSESTQATQQVSYESQNLQESSNVNTMAEQFAAWFYNMMNQPFPIGREHFWNDSELTIHLIGDGGSFTEKAEGDSLEIVNLLFKVKQEHNLYFNPNLLKDGVQGKINPHGLVLVLTCGTLHVNNDCAGVFEQVFALARDPYIENNWKIKKTELNLRKKDVSAPPQLCDSSLTSALLQSPSNWNVRTTDVNCK